MYYLLRINERFIIKINIVPYCIFYYICNKIIYMDYIDKKIIELNNKQLSVAEISKILKKGETTIRRREKSLGIIRTFKPINKVNSTELTYYHSLGMNDAVIAKKLKVSRETVVKYRNKLGLNANKGVFYEKTQLTFEEEQIILGGLLGDLHLSKSDKDSHYRGMFAHCLEQSSFVDYKYNFLSRFCREPYNSSSIDRRSGKRYYRRNCIIYTNPVFNFYGENFYINKIKVVPEKLIQKLEPLGLAIWFMDDGSKCNAGYYLHTNGFDLYSIEILRKLLLEKFNVKTNIHKGNILYIPKESRNTFRILIEPFIINSMKYKL